MKRKSLIATLIGVIIALFGFVWFLQGIGIIPGSIMSGSQFWEMAGAVTVIVGIACVALGVRGLSSP
jgi:hypothetical protein